MKIAVRTVILTVCCML